MVAAKSEIINKFNELRRKYARSLEIIRIEEESLKETKKQLSDCKAAARLFDVELDKEQSGFEISIAENGEIHTSAPFPASPDTIRDFSLNALRQIYPKSLRAKELQTFYEHTHNKKLHTKTIGMTLYRLSIEKPLARVRREGWDWYYVPTPVEMKEFEEGHRDENTLV